MSQRGVLYQWTGPVGKHFDRLSVPQVKGLAAFSLGLGLARQCSLGAVAGKLAELGGRETVERRLRRFLSNDNLELASGCQQWAGWVLGRLPQGGRWTRPACRNI